MGDHGYRTANATTSFTCENANRKIGESGALGHAYTFSLNQTPAPAPRLNGKKYITIPMDLR
jgi:hypothetical protein